MTKLKTAWLELNTFNIKSSNSKQLSEADSFDLKKSFGKEYTIAFDESYQYEKPEFRSPIAFYYTIPAKHGHFYPHDGSTIAFWCTANRIKGQILRLFKGEVTLHVEGDDESILLFDGALFLEIAKIAKAKKKRGRKKLSEKEKKGFVELGKPYRFTGKSPHLTGQESNFSTLSEERYC